MTRGAILGRFLPPHAGHKYLVDFGISFVDELAVLVCTLPTDPIDGELRYRWMREMFPKARVMHVNEVNPQGSRNHPGHWDVWADAIRRYAGDPIDYLFASEDYGWRLAAMLGAEFVPVDPSRTQFPVSGTVLRETPLAYWRFIPEEVRGHFAKRIAVIEIDGEGLCRRLADNYETLHVTDYRNHYRQVSEGPVADDELLHRAQMAAEEALARQCNRLLFSAVPAKHFSSESTRRRYDMVIFSGPLDRDDLAHRLFQELGVAGRHIVHVDGRDSDRFFRACAELDHLIHEG